MYKSIMILSCLTASRADTINTPYSPASPVSSASINDAPKTPAPIHETAEARDGSQETVYSKSVIPFPVQNYDAHLNNAALHTYSTIYSSPIHAPVYSVATPLVTKTYSSPIYTHSTIPVLTKAYSTPILTKTASSGLATYSHSPFLQDQHLKTITYSQAPLVSHMAFSGLGANYSW